MKKLTTIASALVLSATGFAASADVLGNDYGAEIQVTPSLGESISAVNGAGNGSHYTINVVPAQSDKAVAEFNVAIDRS